MSPAAFHINNKWVSLSFGGRTRQIFYYGEIEVGRKKMEQTEVIHQYADLVGFRIGQLSTDFTETVPRKGFEEEWKRAKRVTICLSLPALLIFTVILLWRIFAIIAYSFSLSSGSGQNWSASTLL